MRNCAINTGNFIRTRRKELMMSQMVLTKKLGFRANHSQQLSNCELGKNPFPIKHIYKLSLALQVSPEIIIGKMLEDYSNSIRKELNK
jgi:hypothetical protein